MKKAFTLVELIVVISIGSILLAISLHWYTYNIAASNAKNNRQVDLQAGVKTSLEMVKNTLKNTTQVHLVGKNVYNPDLTLDELKAKKLDTNYNYIALSKDANNNYSLINIVYNRLSKKFESFPITAEIRSDNLNKNKISYNMEFYKRDTDYKEKMKKGLIHITITGNIHDVDDTGKHINPQNDRTFELGKDVDLQNVNQILISKHLQGGIEDVTALAYSNAKIEQETKGSNVKNMAFVFILDTSSSMKDNMKGHPTQKLDERRIGIAIKNIKKFINDIHAEGIQNNIAINAYIFDYGTELRIDTLSESDKYLYEKNDLLFADPASITPEEIINAAQKKYGPFFLGKQPQNMLIHADAHINAITKTLSRNTITGKALLQGLELLNQLEEDRKFLILLTDGRPQSTFYTIYRQTKPIPENSDIYITEQRNVYSFQRNRDLDNNYLKQYYPTGEAKWQKVKTSNERALYDDAMDYIEEVTNPTNGNNLERTFDKAYLIGFSAVPKDIERLGVGAADGSFAPKSIRAYLDRGRNKVKVYEANTSDALHSAFTDIVQSIGDVMGTFDGPNQLNQK